jgi:hypothetical protein
MGGELESDLSRFIAMTISREKNYLSAAQRLPVQIQRAKLTEKVRVGWLEVCVPSPGCKLDARVLSASTDRNPRRDVQALTKIGDVNIFLFGGTPAQEG